MQGQTFPSWPSALRRYLAVIAIGNLTWETAQLPLYTIWRTESARALARAVLHCTAGDVLIGTIARVAALAAVGNAQWPDERAAAVAIAVVVIGIGYTIGSEYVNTAARQSWSYTEWMPTLPWLGTGLAPLAQWIVLPGSALASAHHMANRYGKGPEQMHDMTNAGMMWGMSLFWLLIAVLVLLGIAALAKYLFFSGRG